MGSEESSKLQGPQFHPELSLFPVWSFACSLHFHVGSLHVLQFSPTFQKHLAGLIWYSNLPLSVNECVSWDKFCIRHNPDQDELLTKDEC